MNHSRFALTHPLNPGTADNANYMSSSYIDDDMAGFDTVEIICADKNGDLKKAVKGRIYVTR